MTDPVLLELLTQALRAHGAGDLPLAAHAYGRVLERDPHQPDAWCNLADVLRRLGHLPEALAAGRRAVDAAPETALAHRNLAQILADTGQRREAMASIEEALRIAPGDPALLSTQANLFHQDDDDAAALACHCAALEAAPGHPELMLNVGHGLLRLGHLEQAERVLTLVPPGLPRARWLLAYTRMLQGRWHEAWPDFSARTELPEFQENRRRFPQPRWEGGSLEGRTLLVWGEQGYGDALMALRLLPRLKALGARVLVQTYATLLPVLQASLAADLWLPEGAALPAFDVQVPLLDLPPLLDLDTTEAAQLPPLCIPKDHTPPPELVRALDATTGMRRIGLVWSGNPRHVEQRRRSLDPAQLAPLADLPGITWYGLQVPRTEPPFPGMVDLSPWLRDFADTAWALQRLDALVTVDTACAHLAGGLGLPAHLLLPRFPDWRWGWEGDRTSWYPTLRLHRQTRPGDWTEPMASVAEAILSGRGTC